jgi:hypothetical protein
MTGVADRGIPDAVRRARSRATWPRRRGIVVSHDLKPERLFDASPEVVFAAARVTDRL